MAPNSTNCTVAFIFQTRNWLGKTTHVHALSNLQTTSFPFIFNLAFNFSIFNLILYTNYSATTNLIGKITNLICPVVKYIVEFRSSVWLTMSEGVIKG